jgi:PhzF family phenazine biosynthesis protein
MSPVHAFNCFGAAPGGGNPALVIESDQHDAEARQRIARERRTTCVFIDAGADGVPVLDYFYPHARSPLCLHATLAVARLLLERRFGDGAVIEVRTALRGQPLALSRHGDAYFVALAGEPAQALPVAASAAAALLKVAPAALASKPALRSVGSPKLLAQVKDVAALHALRPDLAAIAAWSRAANVNGCYAWCEAENGDIEGRNFNHLDARLEDSATGVAAGALTLHLGRGLRLRQGEQLGRPCLIVTRLEGDRVLVGGAVEALPLPS